MEFQELHVSYDAFSPILKESYQLQSIIRAGDALSKSSLQFATTLFNYVLAAQNGQETPRDASLTALRSMIGNLGKERARVLLKEQAAIYASPLYELVRGYLCL